MTVSEKLIGDYRLIEKLGEGAAGEVYLATPIRDRPFAPAGHPVAIKIYKSAILKEKDQLERIKREFEIGSGITHPNLARIFEVSLSNPEAPFIVLEFIDGMPLTAWLEQFHPVGGSLLLALFDQLLDGVEQLHDRGIIHRDLKPANIMISSSFEVKIMDFGVAHVPASPPITDENKFLGSIRNASPEYLRGGSYDHTTDLYSLGTVLYALLFGEEVFAEEQHFARLIDLVKTMEPRYDVAETARDAICAGLREVLVPLLEKQPSARPSSIGEVRERLQDLRKLVAAIPAQEPLHGYVATALTNLDGDGRGYMSFASSMIAEVAKQHDFLVYQPRRSTDPVLHRNFPAETVYDLDRRKVVSSDLLIVLLNKPSFGVGQELEIASSYGKPTMLIRGEDVQVSRMVLGAPINIVADIVYSTPEDLRRKLNRAMPLVRAQVAAWRAGVGRRKDTVTLGPRLKEMRLRAGYQSVEQLANMVGIAPRLVQMIEGGHGENVGIQVLQSICAAVESDVETVLGSLPADANPSVADLNERRLEQLARQAVWSATDLLEMRDQYRHEKAARGSAEVIADDEWMRRKNALERKRVGAPTLFDNPNV